jgi:hypothetical protein
MIELQIKMYSDRAKRTLVKLLERVDNMQPIWKDFKQYFQDDLMPRSWNSKGSLMEGGRWNPLTPQYLKWKMSKKNKGSRKLLVLSGKLFAAATGGSGWYDKIDKKSMTMGIQGQEYFYWVQHRQKNPRFYFYTPNEDLPNRAWAYLIKITNELLESADKF